MTHNIFHSGGFTTIGSAIGSNNVVQYSGIGSQIGTVVGRGMTISHNGIQIPEVEKFEIVALDKEGKHIDSFRLKADCRIELSITAPQIDKIETSIAEVTVKEGRVVSISTASGDVTVQQCKNITSINTMSGDITVEKCADLGRASSMSGDVRVRRDASPKRK